MGYIFDFQDTRAYAQWAALEYNRYAAAMEHQLMLNLLRPSPGESVLDIGCGAGFSSRPLMEMGLNVTGIDPSPYMLDFSLDTLKQRVDLYRGFAEDLPFDDNSFNYAVFFISLEFVDDPLRAIEEACRVAKDKVFFGLLNRFALKGAQRWRKGECSPGVFEHARFFNLWKLKKMVHSVVGDVPVTWRTVCQFPQNRTRMVQHFERSNIVQRCPYRRFCRNGGHPCSQVPYAAAGHTLHTEKSTPRHTRFCKGGVGHSRQSTNKQARSAPGCQRATIGSRQCRPLFMTHWTGRLFSAACAITPV